MHTITSLSKKHIVLYADDDADDLMLIREAFDDFASNVEVVTFGDGKQAVTYLQNLSPNDPAPCVIVLDINMPLMSGKEALAAIRTMERFENIPVILFTNSSLLHDKNFATQYNAGFITKPFDMNEMQNIPSQLMEYCPDDVKDAIEKKATS
jgi:CheY-like chemotaxis protein